MDIVGAIKKRILVKIAPSEDLAKKELGESLSELKRAKKAFSDNDEKLVITSSYYSMFHAAKALLFKLGWRERRSHAAISIVLKDLNKKGKLETRFLNYYRSTMNAREGADYHYTYSPAVAGECLSRAEEFSKEMRRLLGLNLNK